MKTNEILNLINDPNTFEINKYQRRAYKVVQSKEDNVDAELSLNGDWNFEFYSDIQKRDQNFMDKKKFKHLIKVPSHIEMSGHGQIQYVNTQYPWDGIEDVKVGNSPVKTNSIGQYTKFIEINNISDMSQYILCFEGVESGFNLWINGNYVGYSTDTFTTCEFEIIEYLKEGINQISVEVYKFTASSWLEDQDFWRFSGIFRDVKLKSISRNHIIDFDINYQLEIGSNKAKATVEIDFIRNNQFAIDITVSDDNDNIRYRGSTEQNIVFTIEDVQLWNAEVPYLYTLKFETETEMFDHKVGFREVVIENKVIKLNKQRIVFKGINRHEFSAYKGRAIDYEDIKADLLLLKKYNFNAIRCSHYPNSPKFYELCDELGFYVIDEVNLETHGTWSTSKFGSGDLSDVLPNDNANYKLNVLSRAANMYERDKNSTCVLIWSLGNESYGGKTLFEMHKLFKQLDKSRLVHYEGVTRDRSYPLTSDLESHMYATSEEIENYFNSDFQKPFILCEYTHAMGNSNGNLSDYLKLEEKYQSYHGGFIWEYMDQAIYKEGRFNYGGDFGDRPTDYNFICDGLVGPNREITDKLIYVSNLFSPIKVNEEQTHFAITNNNTFKYYERLVIKVCKQDKNSKTLITQFKLTLIPGETKHIPKIKSSGVVLYQVLYREQTLKEFSIVNYAASSSNCPGINVRYIEGDKNFGLHAEQFSILFCKIQNNIISLKYDGLEIIESVEAGPKPNFWRAPTNNDIGANMVSRMSIWKMLSNYSYAKIVDYKYENELLEVQIEYKHQLVASYVVHVIYVVNKYGEIDITTKFKSVKGLPPLFNVGLILDLNPQLTSFTYLGCGAIETYCDRNDQLPKKYTTIDIADQQGYLVPQEFGNRTQVNYLNIFTEDGKGFVIESEENFEFSLKNYSDSQLENVRNRADLVAEAPQLRINHLQSGVGGDDSWEHWCKPRFQVDSEQNYEFNICIKRMK